MSINWLWSEKCGEATMHNFINDEDYTVTLYKGNAYLIMLNEWTEDGVEKYSMHSFWADKEHMNAMLGLDKKNAGSNSYNTDYVRMTKIRLNKKKNPYVKQIVDALIKAFDTITIEIYEEE